MDFLSMILGDEGEINVGQVKTCTITYNTQTTTLASPQALNVTKPGNPTVTYTVGQSYYPVLSVNPASVNYAAVLWAGGKNNAATGRDLYWEVVVNGVSRQSGSQLGIAAGRKYVLNFANLKNISLNDVVELYLWGSADFEFNRHAFQIQPLKFKPVNDPSKLLVKTSYTVSNGGPSNLTNNFGANKLLYKYLNTTTSTAYTFSTAFSNLLFDCEHPVYGLFSPDIDINPAANLLNDATNYYTNVYYKIISVSWRETDFTYL